MEQRELVYIQTIAECKSFTKAAEILYVSQPSLSHLVSKVEKRMGAPLFDRSTTPLSLTYAGEVYLRYAKQQLAAKEMLDREFRDICNVKKGRLRIGLHGDRASYLLPEVLPRFLAEYPGFHIQIEEGNREKLSNMLSRGQIDFALLPLMDDIEGAQVKHIGTEQLLMITNPGHFALEDTPGKLPAISIDQLRSEKFIVPKKGHSIREGLDLFFEKNGIQPEIVMEMYSQLATFRLAASGVGIAFLPNLIVRQSLAMQDAQVCRVEPSLQMDWPIGLYYLKGSYIGVAEKRMMAIIQEVFQELTSMKTR